MLIYQYKNDIHVHDIRNYIMKKFLSINYLVIIEICMKSKFCAHGEVVYCFIQHGG